MHSKRAMEKNAEYEKNLLQAKVDSQAAIIESQNEKIAALEKKLDEAYSRTQELATTVAKNSGSTTYVTAPESTPSGKKVIKVYATNFQLKIKKVGGIFGERKFFLLCL